MQLIEITMQWHTAVSSKTVYTYNQRRDVTNTTKHSQKRTSLTHDAEDKKAARSAYLDQCKKALTVHTAESDEGYA